MRDRNTFAKRQRETGKRQKAQEKRARRQKRRESPDGSQTALNDGPGGEPLASAEEQLPGSPS